MVGQWSRGGEERIVVLGAGAKTVRLPRSQVTASSQIIESGCTSSRLCGYIDPAIGTTAIIIVVRVFAGGGVRCGRRSRRCWSRGRLSRGRLPRL
jgi:hypothetical protein